MKKSSQLFLEMLTKRIIILDGAMGTMIQRFGLDESDFRGSRFSSHHLPLRGNNDMLSLTRPDVIGQIHSEYLRAGANVIETNTFNANEISQSDYGTDGLVFELNKASAEIARRAADEENAKRGSVECFVSGSIGPTNRTGSMSPDVTNPSCRNATFDDFVRAYTPQIRGLAEGGADILQIETATDTINAKAAIYAAEEVFSETGIELPIIISATIVDLSGRMLAGQTIEAFYYSIRHCRTLCALGLNCSFGAEHLEPFVKEISELAECAVCFYPNAGLPNSLGVYDETPDCMASRIEQMARLGLLNIVGGCCGTTPDFISAIADSVRAIPPRAYSRSKRELFLSGLEAFECSRERNFINIGERTNAAGSKRFALALANNDWENAASIAKKQVENGAEIIDVCVDMALLDGKKAITTFLNTIAADPAVARVPVMVDSSDWEVIRAALKCIQGKCIVNSISLKSGEEKLLSRAAELKRYGAAVVVMAFDEKGQADTLPRRLDVLRRSFRLLTEKGGWEPTDIILDPNVLAIGTGMPEHASQAVDFIETVRQLKPELRGAKFSGGISNLSYSFRGNNHIRRAIHSVFLYHAINAGLDMGIVNPAQLDNYEEIGEEFREKIENLVLNRSPRATEELLEFCAANEESKAPELQKARRDSIPLDKRISDAIISGNVEFIESDINEAINAERTPLEIIEGPLMAAISHVGELFGSGKLFLPQVVQAARVMKKATKILEPYLGTGQHGLSSGKIVLATVRGDVHDIGKNILSVVLGCNNFEIIDLGVMVNETRVVEAAIENNADIIGLSGLITPSLAEMVKVAELMESKQLRLPLLIGGAATSRLHVALKIAPRYSGPVLHVRDASQAVGIINKILNPKLRGKFLSALEKEYESLRVSYSAKESGLVPIAEARKLRKPFDPIAAQIHLPRLIGIHDLGIKDSETFLEKIDFSHAAKAMGRKDTSIESRLEDDLVSECKQIARAILRSANGLAARVGLFRAYSDIDTVFIESVKNNWTAIPMLRRQTKLPGSNECPSLSDYIAPKELFIDDYLGAFAVTAGSASEELFEQFRSNGEYDKVIMLQSVLNAIADAYAEHAQQFILKEMMGSVAGGIAPAPGYSVLPDHSLKRDIIDLLDAGEKCGIRLTDSYMMQPQASVCGYVFAHPEAKYFSIGKVGTDQLEEYASQRGIASETLKKLLSVSSG